MSLPYDFSSAQEKVKQLRRQPERLRGQHDRATEASDAGRLDGQVEAAGDRAGEGEIALAGVESRGCP